MRPTRSHALRLGLVIVALALLLRPDAALAQVTPEAAKVRVLLVLDTDDGMGDTWGLDGENMKALIEHVVSKQGLQGRVIIDHFTGDKVSPKTVLDYYKRLDVGPDDALLFYFSGHGAFLKSKGHFLGFKRGPLFRKDLLAAMDKKKPRLRLVLTDCCANYVDGTAGAGGLDADIGQSPVAFVHAVQVDPNEGPSRRPPVHVNDPKAANRTIEPPSQEGPLPEDSQRKESNEKAKREEPQFELGRGVDIRTKAGRIPFDRLLDKIDGKILRDLMFRHIGLVDINGSKIGQLSMGTYEWGGSVFTNAFLLLQAEPAAKFTAKENGQVTWEGFFPPWQRLTDELARAYTFKQASQQPHAWKLGQIK
jgi:hypothetical protein